MLWVLTAQAVVFLCMLPFARIGLYQGRAYVIYSSIHALMRNEPCDREQLKHACQSFQQDPNIKALGLLPLDAAVPIDLLRRIDNGPRPKVVLQFRSLMATLFGLLTVVMVLALIAKLIHVFLK